MKKFEYTVRTYKLGDTSKGANDTDSSMGSSFDEMGEDGWELVSVTAVDSITGNYIVYKAFFKK